MRGQVAVRVASGQLRYYEGAADSPRGRVLGLGTKSGTATRRRAPGYTDLVDLERIPQSKRAEDLVRRTGVAHDGAGCDIPLKAFVTGNAE